MTNPDDNKSYREERQDYTDSNGNTHSNVTRSSETVNHKVDPQSYENGYVQGETSERNYQEETLTKRDNENAGRGLLIGTLLTALAALTGGALWYMSQSDRAVDNTVAPVAVPVPVSKPSPAATQAPPQQTTIIERTKEVPVPVTVEKTKEVRVPVPVEKIKEVPVFVPVPQQKAAPAPTPATPNINITVPAQQPAAKETPTTTPKSSSSTAPATLENSKPTATPKDENLDKTDTSPDTSNPQ